jgi:uncharacterized protein (DUF427 family)
MFCHSVAITLPRCVPRYARPGGGRTCPSSRRVVADPPNIGPMTVSASYQGIEIARSDHTVVVEGNHYFLAEDVQQGVLLASESHTVWASYYDVVVGEHRNPDAAWYYPTPKEAAREIADRVAFWKGITVRES